MVIPGLNEISNDKNLINNNFYFQQIITIIQSNINLLYFDFILNHIWEMIQKILFK